MPGRLAVVTHQQKIRELLDRKGVSLAEMAKKAGIPQQTADVLSKRMTDAIVNALKLARVLDVPMDWLYDDSQEWVDLGRAKHPLNLKQEDILIADRVWQQFSLWALRDPEPRDVRKSVFDRLSETLGAEADPESQASRSAAGKRRAGGKGKAS